MKVRAKSADRAERALLLGLGMLVKAAASIILLVAALVTGSDVAGAQAFVNVSPTRSDNAAPNSGTGGRVNNLAMDPTNSQILYAASEWGGVFKSEDGGNVWQHLLAHLPLATWDVAIGPNGVFVSSLYDGRTEPQTGIQFSPDDGATWTQPETIDDRPPNACLNANFQNEISGFGISIDPTNTMKMFVGTNCGLAESIDGGMSWVYVDPTPGPPPGSGAFYDVVVHNGGIVDICGQEGYFRRPAGATAFVAPTGVVPSANPIGGGFGLCSIAISPVDPNTVFVASELGIAESRDGGMTFPTFYPNPEPTTQGRIVNIAVNSLGGNQYNLWFGDVGLWRGACQGTAGGGGPPNCNLPPIGAGPAAWTNVTTGAHDDAGGLLFSNATTNACPIAYANDGGIYTNNNATMGPLACQTPLWAKPSVSPTALWVDDLDGVSRGDENREGLFIGLQDNGQFITENAASTLPPDWMAPLTGDVPEVDASPGIAVTTIGAFAPNAFDCQGNPLVPPNYPPAAPCPPPPMPPMPPMPAPPPVNDTRAQTALQQCWDVPDPTQPVGGAGNVVLPGDFRSFQLQLQLPVAPTPSSPGYVAGEFRDFRLPCQFHPPGQILRFRPMDTYARVPRRPAAYIFATSRGIFGTANITATPPRWSPVGANQPLFACDIRIVGPRDDVAYYIRDDNACSDLAIGALFRLKPPPAGLFPRFLPWQRINTGNPDPAQMGKSEFGIYAVDPNDPDAIVAVDHTYSPPAIVMTTDGGDNWSRLTQLETLMTVDGEVKYEVAGAGPRPGNPDGAGYAQPSVFAFDPQFSGVIVAGGYNSGFFVSTDRGANWQAVSDPTQVAFGRPNISHPLHVHFEHDRDAHNIYIGTRGRGVWRIPLGIEFSIGLDLLTVVDGADEVEQPMVWATFSMRDRSAPTSAPDDPVLRIETRRSGVLGDLRDGARVAIPDNFGEYSGTFIPSCSEAEDGFAGLPSRLFVAVQGWDEGSWTRSSDRRENFERWETAFEGRLRRDIDRNSDETDLNEIADRHWLTSRWFDTDDFIGSNVIVFDREFITNLALSSVVSSTTLPASQSFSLVIPGDGGVSYRVDGYVLARGIPVCQ
ncbi:MAG: hypothetical protein GY788_25160 [bacterium]|nr:hypothetical protein [bacterium]